LNSNGELDTFEDWRVEPAERAAAYAEQQGECPTMKSRLKSSRTFASTHQIHGFDC
jgi:hypothetical protein